MSQAVVSPITQSNHTHGQAHSFVSLITAEAIAMNRLTRETARLIERLEILGMATGEGLRPAVEGAAEALISFLDYLDGDPDLEPEEDNDRSDFEPGLGWSVSGAITWQDGSISLIDLEEEHDGREQDEDFEPTDDNGIADAGGLAEQWSGFGPVTSGVE
jgi:hypothetical protein